MRQLYHLSTSRLALGSATLRYFASASSAARYGRTAPYRRLLQDTRSPSPQQFTHIEPQSLHLAKNIQPLLSTIRSEFSSTPWRGFAASSRSQLPKQNEDFRDSPRQENQSGGRSEDEGSYKEGKEGKSEGKQSEDPVPPPPHGNKSPISVFFDTLKSEFKSSKEWNESTKALTSSAHQFTENESVKKARAAYSVATGTAGSATSSALKHTGKALGQGAAWTWDTGLVKGVRSGVNATGRGIEKATRPVRENKVYKTAVGGVKDVIDDGSSSRYGGWVEKEERRKQRELRELNEVGGRPGAPTEKMEEDPK